MRRFTASSIAVLVVMLAVVAIAAILLAETVTTAQRINDKAQNIAKNGRGINAATDSVIQLRRTNNLALSILRSAAPLQGKLGGIVHVAGGIDGEAGSIDQSATSIIGSATRINSVAHSINGDAGNINTSAGTISNSAHSINGSAGRINGSAGSVQGSALSINHSATAINGSAGSIVTEAHRIDTDVHLINTNLDVTIAIARTIKGDTGNILSQAVSALSNAACIDNHVLGPESGSGQCKGVASDVGSSAPQAPGLLKGLGRLRQLTQSPAPLLPTQPRAHRRGRVANAPALAPAQAQPAAGAGQAAAAPPPAAGPVGVIQEILKKLLG